MRRCLIGLLCLFCAFGMLTLSACSPKPEAQSQGADPDAVMVPTPGEEGKAPAAPAPAKPEAAKPEAAKPADK